MKLNINKPLVIFDLESTGLDLVNDRIIQISYIKVMPSGEEIRESFNVNPGKPIQNWLHNLQVSLMLTWPMLLASNSWPQH